MTEPSPRTPNRLAEAAFKLLLVIAILSVAAAAVIVDRCQRAGTAPPASASGE